MLWRTNPFDSPLLTLRYAISLAHCDVFLDVHYGSVIIILQIFYNLWIPRRNSFVCLRISIDYAHSRVFSQILVNLIGAIHDSFETFLRFSINLLHFRILQFCRWRHVGRISHNMQFFFLWRNISRLRSHPTLVLGPAVNLLDLFNACWLTLAFHLKKFGRRIRKSGDA